MARSVLRGAPFCWLCKKDCLVVEAAKKTVVWLATVGGCWGFVSNPFGIFDGATNRWPAIAAWLPVVGWWGMCVAAAFGIVWSWQSIRPIHRFHSYRHREQRSALNDLRELQAKLAYRHVPSNTARADIIAGDLIQTGILHVRIRELGHDMQSAYISRVETVIERHGVDNARVSIDVLIEPYLKRL